MFVFRNSCSGFKKESISLRVILAHYKLSGRKTNLASPNEKFGVRALCEKEVCYRNEHNIAHLDAKVFHQSGVGEIVLPADFPDTVILTLDVDGLDPSIIRAAGTPRPGRTGMARQSCCCRKAYSEQNGDRV